MIPIFDPKYCVLMEGAGNSFAILDLIKAPEAEKPSPEDRRQLATQLETFFGQRLDGLIFLEYDEKYDFAWDFYNNDGSSAEMCGNAARCVSKYFLEKRQQKIVKFRTKAGVISGALAEKEVAVTMTDPKNAKSMTLLLSDGIQIEGYFIDTGVPHFVITGNLDRDLAKKVRSHSSFGKAGTNVTFITKENPENSISVQTFERGVEDFTQACGTGAVAAAFTVFLKNPNLKRCHVLMPGGQLIVTHAHPPLLIGPANYLTWK
jgi:diaminopimelate epimerase